MHNSTFTVLHKILVGEFISFFGLGDSWSMAIGNFYLVAQNIIFQDEKKLHNLLLDNIPQTKSSIDPEDISKSAILSICMKQNIIDIHLDKKYSLTIKFENELQMQIPTNEPIVDWQWAINKSCNDPYRDYIVASFWEGEIEINKELKFEDL